MNEKETKEIGKTTLRRRKHVAGNRAVAQRDKLDAQAEARMQQATERAATDADKPRRGQVKPRLQASRRASTTIARAIEDYLQDHAGRNSSPKTLEWHGTALGLMQTYLEKVRGITLVGEIDAPDISAWFADMRTSPGSRGKTRSERTIQTYARSARAFFHWLVHREIIQSNPFDRVVFPKVGKPLIQTIDAEEFERLLLACTPTSEAGPIAERAAVRNRAILWVFYDTGIRISELCGLHLADFDRKRGLLTVKGKGSKERRVALGQNCLRNLLYYLDKQRPDEEELAEWGSAGEDHLFLAETRTPLTKNGVTLLFACLRKRAGITGKRISAHIFRHPFAIRYLKLGNDPFSLQELLGHEDLLTVRLYMHMNDEDIQEQKRKYSPGDHLPTRMPGPRETRRNPSLCPFSSKQVGVSSDERFEPVREFHEFELARLLGAVKGIAHDDLAQLGHRVDVAEHAVEQVEKPLQVVMGRACRVGPKGFEQAFALGGCDPLHAFHHL